MADWLKIKAEYISGCGSMRELAEKYGVSIDAVKRRAASEKWSNERTKTAPKIHQKTVRKVVERTADREADRIARLLAVSDVLLAKAERAALELGEIYTVKRKETRVEVGEDDKPVVIDETTEIAVSGKAAVQPAHLKQLASALKDLRDVAETVSAGEEAPPIIREDVPNG